MKVDSFSLFSIVDTLEILLTFQGININEANTNINVSKLWDNTVIWNIPLYMLNPDPMDWIYKPLNERAAEIIKAIVANLVYNIDVIPPLSKFILDGVIAIAIMNKINVIITILVDNLFVTLIIIL